MVEALASVGVRAVVINQHNPHLRYILTKFRTFVLQRVIWNDSVAEVMAAIKQSGGEMLFETDDLVFDPAYLSQMHYYTHMGATERQWYENGIGREILEDASVKRCVVSTDFLAEAMRKKYPKKEVFVEYNRLGEEQIRYADRAVRLLARRLHSSEVVRLGYFSGSRSHDADFASIEGVLAELLKRHANVRLVLVGHIEISEALRPFANQIEQIAFVPYKKLAELVASVDVNLAPLEPENDFCLAKSAIKYMEAGVCAAPTVATTTGDFERCIRTGENGMLARTADEWRAALEFLIADRTAREAMGQSARADALARHTVCTAGADLWLRGFEVSFP
jgi:glycosyltransferase involved in cell wall biosynthesis